jgi:metallo-beta-lactamase class B
LGKLSKAAPGPAGESIWVDPKGYQAAVAEREQAFEAELRKQQG